MVARRVADRVRGGLLCLGLSSHCNRVEILLAPSEARTQGTLDRVEGKMRFTRFDTHAKLHVAAGADVERAKKLLEKAESSCLVANSLNSERHLTVEVLTG